jgi:hypothetical protein
MSAQPLRTGVERERRARAGERERASARTRARERASSSTIGRNSPKSAIMAIHIVKFHRKLAFEKFAHYILCLHFIFNIQLHMSQMYFIFHITQHLRQRSISRWPHFNGNFQPLLPALARKPAAFHHTPRAFPKHILLVYCQGVSIDL